MFGAEAEMTLESHNSGSDRIAEVVERHPEIAYIVNLQGDEPMIDPENIDKVIRLVKDDDTADVSTLVTEIKDIKEVENPNLIAWHCKSCEVDINLTSKGKEISIKRNTHKPLEIYIDGKLLSASNKRDTQEILEEEYYFPK